MLSNESSSPVSIKIRKSSAASFEGKSFPFEKLSYSIGNGLDNDIVIPDPTTPLHRAQISYSNDDGWGIVKLTPQIELRVNQEYVPWGSQLQNGDMITLGKTTFTFQAVSSFAEYYTAKTSGTQALGNKPTLEVTSNTGRKKSIHNLTGKQVFSIGNHPSNEIVIDDPIICEFHAQIERNDNLLYFVYPHPGRSKEAADDTYYKGQKVHGHKQVLVCGDFYRITNKYGSFITLTYKDGTGEEQEAQPKIDSIPLGTPVLKIGRLPNEDGVVLNHPQVSRDHARLEQVQPNVYSIADQGSTNSTFVNGRRISRDLQKLEINDEIRIGPFKLIYTGTHLEQYDESTGIRIDAKHLTKKVKRRTTLLNDISIVIQPCRLVALVGSSGTGKSTLLEVLSGLRSVRGVVLLSNNEGDYSDRPLYSTQISYVPQEDILHLDLTVKHALYYAAKLRLPDDYRNKQINESVDEALGNVDMVEHGDKLVSELSGGERKRVSIAIELLAKPDVFFLDEPTSGLDAGLDRKMMWLLRRLADRGCTIVLVTHTITNIDSCDYVCFLATGGRLAYFGPPDDAKAFFNKANFAEIYSALEPTDEDKSIPEQAEKKFQQSKDYEKHVAVPLSQGPMGRVSSSAGTKPIKLARRGNALKQFLILCLRYLELLKNDARNLLFLLLQAPIIGLLLFFLAGPSTFSPTNVADCPTRPNPISQSGPIVSDDCQRVVKLLVTPEGQAFAAQYGKSPQEILQAAIVFGSGGDAQRVLLIMSIAAVLFGCINGCREIVKELPIYRRERAVNLGIAPYLFSKIAILGTLCLLQSYILVELVQLSAPFHQGIILSPFLEIYITMALTSLAGLMMGLFISAIVANSNWAMSLLPVALLPQVIFSGAVFSLDQLPYLQIVGVFVPARWAMAAMGSTVGLHGDKLGADSFSYWGTLFSTYDKGMATLHLLLCWGALAATCIILGILIVWQLKLKDVRT